jgi:hypothetical protein
VIWQVHSSRSTFFLQATQSGLIRMRWFCVGVLSMSVSRRRKFPGLWRELVQYRYGRCPHGRALDFAIKVLQAMSISVCLRFRAASWSSCSPLSMYSRVRSVDFSLPTISTRSSSYRGIRRWPGNSSPSGCEQFVVPFLTRKYTAFRSGVVTLSI